MPAQTSEQGGQPESSVQNPGGSATGGGHPAGGGTAPEGPKGGGKKGRKGRGKQSADGGDSDHGSVHSAAGSGWENFPDRCCILHLWGKCRRSPEQCSYGPHIALASAPESVKHIKFYKRMLAEHGEPTGVAGSSGPAAESAKAS